LIDVLSEFMGHRLNQVNGMNSTLVRTAVLTEENLRTFQIVLMH